MNQVAFNNAARSMPLVQKALLRSHEQNVVPVVIVEDAQALDTRAWLGLKTLTNHEMDPKVPFCLWSPGPRQELLAPLRQSGLAGVRGRLQFCFHLKNVQGQEIQPYLAARLKRAGCDRALFRRDLSREICRLPHGLARQISRLAWHCLMAAAPEARRQ
jgi:general secretion pathway protein A